MMVKMFVLTIMLSTTLCLFGAGDHRHAATAQVVSNKVPVAIDQGRGLQLRVRQDGVLFAAWALDGHVYLQQSRDRGRRFSNPMVVNPEPLAIRAGGESRIGLALGKNEEVYVCFVEKLEQKWTSNLLFTRSLDGGLSFEPLRRINDDVAVSSHSFPVMNVAPDGGLTLVWIDGRDRLAARKAGQEMEGLSLYGTRSFDGGQSFAANQRLVKNTCQCCRLALAFNGDAEAVVLWRHIYAGSIRDHGFGIWRKGGFSQQRFSFENWQFMGCPHQGPALVARSKGGFHAAWYSAAEDRARLYFANVDADGAQLGNPLDLGLGMHPAIAVYKDAVHLLMLTSGDLETLLVSHVSRDGGHTWDPRKVLAKGTVRPDHPQWLQLGDGLYWAWQVDDQFQLQRLN